MKKETIIRAWRDPEFRDSLTSEERAALPECPAGQSITELDEGALASAVGGALALAQLDLDTPCVCTDWTVPITTTKTSIINVRQQTIREQTVLQVNQAVVLGR